MKQSRPVIANEVKQSSRVIANVSEAVQRKIRVWIASLTLARTAETGLLRYRSEGRLTLDCFAHARKDGAE